MSYLHYLHHLWVDPLSASDELEAWVLVGLPLTAITAVCLGLWQWFWERYNGE
jgi:hypothetical protein